MTITTLKITFHFDRAMHGLDSLEEEGQQSQWGNVDEDGGPQNNEKRLKYVNRICCRPHIQACQQL